MIFSTFRVVQLSPHSILEYFHCPKKQTHTHWRSIPFSPPRLPGSHSSPPVSGSASPGHCTSRHHTTCGLCDRLLSPGIMFSRSIPVVVRIGASPLFMATLYPVVQREHVSFTHHQLMDMCVASTMNNAAMNICLQLLSGHVLVSLG